jgi:hypothetical protein
MSQRVKTKRQANLKDFKRFGAFKGLVEHKKNVVCIQLVRGLFMAHSCHKEPSLHRNSLNNILLLSTTVRYILFIPLIEILV